MCGEQNALLTVSAKFPGSSPRVRGTEDSANKNEKSDRFIPACAGNRALTVMNRQQSAVHPRVCGEQNPCLPGCHGITGSSPRVRGTVIETCGSRPAGRFIPACAGNSRFPRKAPRTRSVHPRVCGEQNRRCVPDGRAVGSSPRVRGTEFAAKIRYRDKRFIPACAGNRVHSLTKSCSIPVHPRVCGEQCCLLSTSA